LNQQEAGMISNDVTSLVLALSKFNQQEGGMMSNDGPSFVAVLDVFLKLLYRTFGM